MASGIAQILYLDVPDHAAVDVTVNLVQSDPDCRRYVALANAVLRRVAREKHDLLRDHPAAGRQHAELVGGSLDCDLWN